MNISQITGVYFSPTGSTKRVTEWITERIAGNREAECLDLTDAASSRPDYTFTEHELAVYGGRVPETARERLQKIHGKRTPAVLIVTYGNRAYEDALLELSDILKEQGFIPAAAAAVVTEHNIAHVYGTGRPDEKDKKEDENKSDNGTTDQTANPESDKDGATTNSDLSDGTDNTNTTDSTDGSASNDTDNSGTTEPETTTDDSGTAAQ